MEEYILYVQFCANSYFPFRLLWFLARWLMSALFLLGWNQWNYSTSQEVCAGCVCLCACKFLAGIRNSPMQLSSKYWEREREAIKHGMDLPTATEECCLTMPAYLQHSAWFLPRLSDVSLSLRHMLVKWNDCGMWQRFSKALDKEKRICSFVHLPLRKRERKKTMCQEYFPKHWKASSMEIKGTYFWVSADNRASCLSQCVSLTIATKHPL